MPVVQSNEDRPEAPSDTSKESSFTLPGLLTTIDYPCKVVCKVYRPASIQNLRQDTVAGYVALASAAAARCPSTLRALTANS